MGPLAARAFACATTGGMHLCGHQATQRAEPQARERCKNARSRGRPTPGIREKKNWGDARFAGGRGGLLGEQACNDGSDVWD